MTLPRLSEDGGHYFPIFLSYGLRFFLVLLRSITPQMKLFKKYIEHNRQIR